MAALLRCSGAVRHERNSRRSSEPDRSTRTRQRPTPPSTRNLTCTGVRATVTDRQDGELTVSTETAGTVVVHIAEQTIIMDTQTGLPAGYRISKGVTRCTSTAGK